MKDGKISKLVMAIISKDTAEVLERWQFDVHIFGKHASQLTPFHPISQSDKENK
jgi:mitotic spindle assembly checkpoint protein MAD2